MTSLFRYDAARVDERLVEWVRQHHRASVETVEEAEQRGSGFTASRLAGAGGGGAHFGQVTNELWNLAYWLFVCAGNPVIVHPDAGSEAKSVLAADVQHRPPGAASSGIAYLAVWATEGAGQAGDTVLVPFPRVGDSLIKPNSGANFRQCRDALHAAAIACVDRVNLVWPAALTLAVGAAKSASDEP